MQTRLRLLQEWCQQLQAIIPEVRITRIRTLALFTLGLVSKATIALPRVAEASPWLVKDTSTERRFRRWLANNKVPVTAIWRPFIKTILKSRDGQEVVLALDPTPHNETASIIELGIVAHKRVLPVAWHVAPNQKKWPRHQIAYLRRQFQLVKSWLPANCTVTLIADMGLTSPDLIRLCQEMKWHFVLRLSVDEKQGAKVRDAEGNEQRAWELVRKPGQKWYGERDVFKEAGWLKLQISIIWKEGYDKPWILLSDRTSGYARINEYSRRVRAEATYEDCKSRGWDIERSKVKDLNRLNRLLLAVFIAMWWSTQLGMQAIRKGIRRLFDRTDRRDLSVVRIGRRFLIYRLDRGLLPPLLFYRSKSSWRFSWLF